MAALGAHLVLGRVLAAAAVAGVAGGHRDGVRGGDLPRPVDKQAC